MEIARYERRLLAYMIDILICLGLGVGTWFFVRQNWSLTYVMQIIICETLMGIYYFFFAGIILRWTNGYTIGGALVRTKVVHIDDRDISYRDAFLRSICLSVLPWVIVNACYMLIIHTERTIFDKITDTIVIDRRHWK